MRGNNMFDKIIEVFTKPKIELTFVDELIQATCMFVIIILIVGIYAMVKNKKNRR